LAGLHKEEFQQALAAGVWIEHNIVDVKTWISMWVFCKAILVLFFSINKIIHSAPTYSRNKYEVLQIYWALWAAE
jgi:hypothetical protein